MDGCLPWGGVAKCSFFAHEERKGLTELRLSEPNCTKQAKQLLHTLAKMRVCDCVHYLPKGGVVGVRESPSFSSEESCSRPTAAPHIFSSWCLYSRVH